ncbi:hypothetical protein [Sedimentibacter sp.]|uniref:hypothetical protein n=1 Tax=Sedimentibacter sp. TaxID=1960295 RepID=UPI00289A2C04|nr:hypothetical protein [Sedimentibacter sp.]
MKKILILMTALFLFLVGCGKLAEDDKINFSFDENGNYTGFSDLPSNYTVEDAKSDGYFTSMGVEIVANKELWDRFAEKSHNNNDASIRMVKFMKKVTAVRILRIYFTGMNIIIYLIPARKAMRSSHTDIC